MTARVLAYLALLATCLSLLGCATDVQLVNPRTGETAVCPAHPGNPWSQQQACIGDHIARGWARQD